MTYKEVKDRFVQGEPIQTFFGIRKITYTIGKDSITEKQYRNIQREFESKSDFKIDTSGYTKHILTYKNE